MITSCYYSAPPVIVIYSDSTTGTSATVTGGSWTGPSWAIGNVPAGPPPEPVVELSHKEKALRRRLSWRAWLRAQVRPEDLPHCPPRVSESRPPLHLRWRTRAHGKSA